MNEIKKERALEIRKVTLRTCGVSVFSHHARGMGSHVQKERMELGGYERQSLRSSYPHGQ